MLRTLSTVDQGLIEVANSLLVQLHVPVHVESLEDINANVFVTLFEGLYGEPLPEILLNPQTKQDNIHNCQVIIDTLATKILHTSLSHITGEDIVEGDRASVANLLEILTGLLEFLTEKIESESNQDDELEEDVFRNEVLLDSGDGIDQLMDGIRNLPRLQKNSEREIEGGQVKAAWQDFENPADFQVPDPERDLLVSPVNADDDPHNLTFSIPASPVGPPQPSKSPTPKDAIPPPSTSPTLGEPIPPPQQPSKSPTPDEPVPPPSKTGPIIEPLPLTDPVETIRKLTVTVIEDKATTESDTQKKDTKQMRPPPRKVSNGHHLGRHSKKLPHSTKADPFHPKSLKGSSKSKESLHVKVPRHEESSSSPESENDEFSPEEVTELLKTYGNDRTTDELLDMMDATLRQLEVETRSATSPERLPHKKQVRFSQESPPQTSSSSISLKKKVKKSKAPTSMWHHTQGDWKKNKKLKVVRMNYADDLAELRKDAQSKAKAEKTAANEREKDLRKAMGGCSKSQNTVNTTSVPVPKKKTRKPDMNARVYTTTKEVNGEDLLPALLEEFPHLQLSMETWHELWRKSIVQLEYLTRSYRASRRRRDQSQQQIIDAEKRRNILYEIIKKELTHAERMKEMKESKKQRIALKNRLHEKRITSARARKYYNEFSAQMRSRMMSKRTKEEMIFKRLFQDSLHIQRERIQELQKYLREIRSHRSQKLQNEIDSMENFYHDQFEIVAENMKRQTAEKMAQEEEQTQLVKTLKRDLRKKMEQDVQSIQKQLFEDEDDAHFRQLDAERVKRELQLANYVFKLRPRSYLWNSDH